MELDKEKLIEIVTTIVDKTIKNSFIIPAGIMNSGSSEQPAQTVVSKKEENDKKVETVNSLKLLNKKLIVEEDIKSALKKNIATIEINKSAKITPLAADMILHKKIKLIKH